MKLKIKVTKEILEASKHCPSLRNLQCDIQVIKQNCAFALALRDIFPEAEVKQWSTILIPGTRTVYNPKEMVRFIMLFDNCETIADRENLPEVEVEMDVPDEIIDKIGISEAHRIISESKTLELV